MTSSCKQVQILMCSLEIKVHIYNDDDVSPEMKVDNFRKNCKQIRSEYAVYLEYDIYSVINNYAIIADN